MEFRSANIKEFGIWEQGNLSQEKLDDLDNEIYQGNDYFRQPITVRWIRVHQDRTQAYLPKKGKEAMFRSKARWIEKGQKEIYQLYF